VELFFSSFLFRRKQRTKVFLNLYDLSPANEYLYRIGMGLHHSGIEVNGTEYSYGSGGSGIFDSPPKVAPNAKFRCTIELGSFDGGTQELNKALDEIRHHGGFGPNNYNLIRKNCNHFCNALSWQLLRKPIPPYVNRLANIGECCSCILPTTLLGDSPVGGTAAGSSDNNRMSSSLGVPSMTAMNRGASSSNTMNAFAGKGHSLGGSTMSGSSGRIGSTTTSSPTIEANGLLSRWSSSTTSKVSTTTTGSNGNTTVDDLTDRREKARIAALARLERSQQQQQLPQVPSQQLQSNKES
jgi:hypothetical protein